ncbi:MAG: hypothetical protein KJ052_10990 [Candidatus Hydrogenedentes bacterium]|nr:hypothetical protein [Candidatus Hydrogenedentota bacterium]
MNPIFRIAAVLLIGGLVSISAMAVDPAYNGKEFGNPEEPAMRPYKWFLRGVASVVYFPARAFVQGNADYPILGTANTFKGLRVGLVEWNVSVWNGLMGSQVRPYKVPGKTNFVIQEDWLLRNTADAAATVYGWGILTGSAGLQPELFTMTSDTVHVSGAAGKSAAATFLANKSMKHVIKPVPEWEKHGYWPKRFDPSRGPRVTERTISENNEQTDVLQRESDEVKSAQRRYIGRRADTNNKVAEGRGNLLQLADR